MGSIDVKDEVRRAVQSEWPGFAERHPRLAAVLDETLVVQQAVESIADDPEYVRAMERASAIGAGAEVVADVVRRFVGVWLKRLVG